MAKKKRTKHRIELDRRRKLIAHCFGLDIATVETFGAKQLEYYYVEVLRVDPFERLRRSWQRFKVALWRAFYLDVVFPWWV